MNKPLTQKALWKAQLLEFLHNCQIGISHLECSQENCPLVLNWGHLERKNSKQGYGALVKITRDKFLTVDIQDYELNGLEEAVNITIKYRDKKEALVRTRAEIEELTQKLSPEERAELSFLDPSEVVCFFNNPLHRPNLEDAEEIYLEDLWETKQKIRWDQRASKKKIINWVEQKVDGDDKAYKIEEWENDYIFNIHNPDTTNEIKAHEVYSAPNTKEREQLWEDYLKEFSELRRVYGIRHLTSKKEDRQNNPEIELNEAQFVALERDKWRERMRSIKEAESKGFCLGKHTLTYGAWQERQEAEIEAAQELKNDPIQELIRQNEKEDKHE
jgi:hypothetical protein